MRNAILGTIAGLLVGSVGALAYSHFVGDGSLVADLQAQLDDARAKLAASDADKKLLKQQNNDESDQVNQLVASNEQLKKQVASPGDTPAAPAEGTPAPSLFDPNLLRGIMAAMRGGRGGFRSPEQRMFLLQARLKLTPDQQAKIKAAMDADEQARRDVFRQARENHTPPDPQALAAANTLDKTLSTVLSQYQQAQYQQLQSDQRAAQAEASATSQVDDLMPLLQLTDDQKEKAMNVLYQQQLSAPDPATLMANPTGAVSALASQGQSMQSALQKVLTPDQYALYQQQVQAFANFGGGQNRRNNNGGNGNGGGQAQGYQISGMTGTAQTAATPAAATPTPAAPAPATTDASAAATSAASATSATTNAASTNAPAAAPAN